MIELLALDITYEPILLQDQWPIPLGTKRSEIAKHCLISKNIYLGCMENQLMTHSAGESPESTCQSSTAPIISSTGKHDVLHCLN